MRVSFDDLPRVSHLALVDGAFDPLHPGHIDYLIAARAIVNGPLLCSLASDADIRAKGREPLLTQDQRARVLEAVTGITAVFIKDRPTEAVLEALKPKAYIKGPDWKGRLPEEQADVCGRYGIPIIFTDGPTESSSRLLADWSLRDAERQLDRLETFVQGQTETPIALFDQAYFTNDWRSGVEPYTWEGRKKAEGRHAKIVKECFDGLTVLDVGCGPGHFVRMLREIGMDAGGVDPSPDAVALGQGLAGRVACGDVANLPPKIAHVAISREVLEHLTVWQVSNMIADLFRVARKFVYITTRFSADGVFGADTDFDTDPTHITLLSQPYVRSLCVLNGGTRRRDLEAKLDHQAKGRVLVYEVH